MKTLKHVFALVIFFATASGFSQTASTNAVDVKLEKPKAVVVKKVVLKKPAPKTAVVKKQVVKKVVVKAPALKGNKVYRVKKGRIFFDDKDITETYTSNQKAEIYIAAEGAQAEVVKKEVALEQAKIKRDKEVQNVKNAQEALKNAKDVQRTASERLDVIKTQIKSTEKKGKKRMSLEKALEAAKDKYASKMKEYNKQDRRGDLSPNDHKRWDEKFELQKAKIEDLEERIGKF